MSILKFKDSQGNWIGVPTLKGDNGNGISSAVLNGDYTLTLTFTDGTTYTTPSIRGEKGEQGDPASSMDIHICSSSEYDSQTRIPTIAQPNNITFYLVPTVDGTSPDLFTEWVYVNNAWEMFGSVKIDLSGYLTDVQVNGTSVVTDGVANVPIAGSSAGVVKIDSNNGVTIGADGKLYISSAIDLQVKRGEGGYRPITPPLQHKSVFYGLAKASGDTTQSQSDNAVGTYTEEAKASIQSMLGVPSEDDVVSDVQINGSSIVTDGVAEIPIMSANDFGVAKIQASLGVGITGGKLALALPTSAQIKNGNAEYGAVTTLKQHQSTFYGLAKAAGDSTQSTSSNEVGTYTDEAKTAIKQMLGIHDTYDSFIEDVTGTDVTITGQPSYRYNCGEVYSLTVTPPSSGTIDFRFTSGSTPTVLTLPSTVKMPEWWVEIEANTIYEMCITDGVYCGVMSWAM